MVQVVSYEIDAICHATEDVNKVMKCMLTFVPPDERQTTKISYFPATGHYGDEIYVLKAMLGGKAGLRGAKWFFSLLSKEEQEEICASFHQRLDGSKLYLRCSKKDSYLGRIKLDSGDNIVKVCIRLKGYLKSKSAEEILKESNLV